MGSHPGGPAPAGTGDHGITDWPQALSAEPPRPARRYHLGHRLETGLLMKATGVPKTNSAHHFQGKGQLKIYSEQNKDILLG